MGENRVIWIKEIVSGFGWFCCIVYLETFYGYQLPELGKKWI